MKNYVTEAVDLKILSINIVNKNLYQEEGMRRKHNGNEKKEKKIPKIKKDIKDFLLSEEGKITKKDLVKIGMGLAVLSLMFPSPAAAGHTNAFFASGQGGHTSHSSHGSHGSHGNHSRGGWC